MNAIIFARGNNIELQIEEGMKYAERQGYTVKGVIVGNGQELTGAVKALQSVMKIDRIIAWNASRISRNALENYTIQAELEIDYGVLVETANPRRKDEAFDNFMKNVVIAAREEARKTERRIKLRLGDYDI